MKRSQTKSTEKGKQYSATQRTGVTPKKNRKSGSYTQGDNIEDILFEIDLKKPRRAYNYYIKEMKEKENSSANITEIAKKYAPKWGKLTDSEKSKYQKMAEEDQERYHKHLEMVRAHILKKPLKEEATSYRIFQDELVRKAIENNEDPKDAKKKASEQWKNMTAEDKKEWNEKKKAHLEWYENLKKSKGVPGAYALFVRDQLAAAKEKGDSMTFKEASEKWNKAKNSVKEKYQQYAQEEKEERMKHRDLYEIAFGLKPRRPHGAFKFFLMQAAKEGKLDKGNPLTEGHKLWKKLPEDQKEIYERMAKKDKLAYLVKKLEYEATIKKSNTNTRPLSAIHAYMTDMKDKLNPQDYSKEGFFQFCWKKFNKLDESIKRKYEKKATEANQDREKEVEEVKARVFDMPKRPGNSYTIFIQESIPKLREEHPKKEVNELFKLAAEKWSSLSDKNKEKYSKKYETELEHYKGLLNQWKENGFYTPDKVAPSKGKRSQSKSRSSSMGKSKRGKKSVKNE